MQKRVIQLCWRLSGVRRGLGDAGEGSSRARGGIRAALSVCQGVSGAGGGERPGSSGLVTWPAGGVVRGVDFEALADGGGDGVEVAGVGADDQVVAA